MSLNSIKSGADGRIHKKWTILIWFLLELHNKRIKSWRFAAQKAMQAESETKETLQES